MTVIGIYAGQLKWHNLCFYLRVLFGQWIRKRDKTLILIQTNRWSETSGTQYESDGGENED